eukprot:Clim_evm15s235 gene=Clim_evmTU15s235
MSAGTVLTAKSGNSSKQAAVDQELRSGSSILGRRLDLVKATYTDSFLDDLRARYKPINPNHVKAEVMSRKRRISNGGSSANGQGVANGNARTTSNSAAIDVLNMNGAMANSTGTKKQKLTTSYGVEGLGSTSFVPLNWTRSTTIGASLHNLGNTCFMNAVLQCLTYTPPLAEMGRSSLHRRKPPGCQYTKKHGSAVQEIVRQRSKHQNDASRQDLRTFCMLCELERHIGRALDGHKVALKPMNIISRLKSIAKHFKLGRQEDAHEFLGYVLDRAHNACHGGEHKVKDMPLSMKRQSVVYQLFSGIIESRVDCLSCKYRSATKQVFLDLAVDLKTGNLVDCLRQMMVPEILEKSNSYRCDNCKKLVRAAKGFAVLEPPQILIFHLKRFNPFGGKVNRHVSFPMSGLNLNFMLDVNVPSPIKAKKQGHTGPGPIYELYGVIVHEGGSVHSGHYYAYVKNSNGHWYCMDDTTVTRVNESTVRRASAYLLFYRATTRLSSTIAQHGDAKMKKTPEHQQPTSKKEKHGPAESLMKTATSAASALIDAAVKASSMILPNISSSSGNNSTNSSPVKKAMENGHVVDHNGDNNDDEEHIFAYNATGRWEVHADSAKLQKVATSPPTLASATASVDDMSSSGFKLDLKMKNGDVRGKQKGKIKKKKRLEGVPVRTKFTPAAAKALGKAQNEVHTWDNQQSSTLRDPSRSADTVLGYRLTEDDAMYDAGRVKKVKATKPSRLDVYTSIKESSSGNVFDRASKNLKKRREHEMDDANVNARGHRGFGDRKSHRSGGRGGHRSGEHAARGHRSGQRGRGRFG